MRGIWGGEKGQSQSVPTRDAHFDNVRDDFHIAVRVGPESSVRLDEVVVHHLEHVAQQ
jgi:hypothetical protein